MILKSNKAFRNLFLGRISSVFADAIMFFALLKWVELQTGNSNFFTFFYIVFYIPVAFLTLPIGAWISNKTLQKVMVYSNMIQAGVIIAFLITMPFIAYEWIYVFLVILSILGIFFVPANQSLLPHVVNEEYRPSANSMLQLGLTAVKMAGQVFTATAIKLSTDPASLLILSVALMLISLLFIRRVKPDVKDTVSTGKRQWTLIREGVSYITGHPTLRMLFLFLTMGMFIVSSVDLLLIHFLTDHLSTGVENLSFIGTASLTGITIGALLSPRLYKRTNEKKWLILPLFFALSLSIGSLYFITNWLYILPFFMMQGVTLGIFNIAFVTYLQETVASTQYTRTFSLYHMLTGAMALPGVLLIGGLLSSMGIKYTIVIMAGMLLLLGIASILFMPALRMESVVEKG